MKKISISAIVLLIIIVFSVLYFDTPLDYIRPVFHKQIINSYAQQYKIDPLFITAIIKVESKFLHNARSHRGAVGLMQIMPSTAEELAKELGYETFSEKDLEDPEYNINMGMYYISKLDKMFQGNKIMILAAYNAGIGNVESWRNENPGGEFKAEDITFKETKYYVENVLRTYKWLKETQKIKKLIRGRTL